MQSDKPAYLLIKNQFKNKFLILLSQITSKQISIKCS